MMVWTIWKEFLVVPVLDPHSYCPLTPSKPGMPRFTAQQGAVVPIIKTFQKKDLMFKGAAPEKR